ncbi:MAG: tetratricopeptide repeat protein [Planctomycetes bacterium]|nr:tetratricopeptide repeat protein [Planctomycetota bacterium]
MFQRFVHHLSRLRADWLLVAVVCVGIAARAAYVSWGFDARSRAAAAGEQPRAARDRAARQEAETLVREALRLTPRDPDVAERPADVQANLLETAFAIHSYETCLDVDPRRVTARLKLGELLTAGNFLDKAERLYRDGLELHRRHAALEEGLAAVLVAKGDPASAASLLTALLAREPTRPRANMQIARIFAAAADRTTIGDAARHYEAALAHLPPGGGEGQFSHAACLSELGLTLARIDERAADAEARLKEAVEAAPRSVTYRLNLAQFYRLQKRRDEAEKAVNAALSMDPASVDATTVLVLLHLDRGEIVRARDAADRLMLRRPEEHARLSRMIEDYVAHHKYPSREEEERDRARQRAQEGDQ